MVALTTRVGPGSRSPTSPANAPSGRLRADAVPVAQRVAAPRRASADSASLASRVLPTPAAPASTTPRGLPTRLLAASMNRNSSARPVSGQLRPTTSAYETSTRAGKPCRG